MTTMVEPTTTAQIRLARRSPAYWRVTNDNPPINVMGPEMVRQFQEVIAALDADGIKALMARGFHKPGDAENRLGYYLGQITR
jgi:hypothetical protein